MATLIDFLENDCNETFDMRELNDLDSLVLCSASYFHYNRSVGKLFTDHHIPNIKFKNIKNIDSLTKLDKTDDNFLSDWLLRSNKIAAAFLNPKNKRYKNLRVNYHESLLLDEPSIQFSAIVFFLDSKRVYIAFRGSDGSIAGYKEDFNMCFSERLPSFDIATKYLDTVIELLDEDKIIYVGGHSKGGCFAKYAFLNSKHRDRITKVYDHDGPGFLFDIKSMEGYNDLVNKLERTVPRYDIVGFLLNNPPNHKVVQSQAMSPLYQHFPHTWLVENKDLVYIEKTNIMSRYMDEAIKTWLKNTPLDKRKEFIDVVFEIFEKAEITSVNDFKINAIPKIRKLFTNYSKLDKDEKKIILKTFHTLFRSIFSIDTTKKVLNIQKPNDTKEIKKLKTKKEVKKLPNKKPKQLTDKKKEN